MRDSGDAGSSGDDDGNPNEFDEDYHPGNDPGSKYGDKYGGRHGA